MKKILYNKWCVLMDEKRNEIILFENQGIEKETKTKFGNSEFADKKV